MYDICDTSLEERESESILNSIRVHSEEIEFDVNIAQSTHKFSCSQILLDTCAGESVFRDSELFHSIVPSTNSLIVNGVNKDSHPLIISESGETDFGMVYYNKDCVANILSFGKVVNNSHSVRYIERTDSFIVQVKQLGLNYRFKRDLDSNLYICDLDTMVYKSSTVNVATVSDRKKKYTIRQIQQAELAREYQRKLGYTSPGQLIKMISHGKLENGTIVAQDVLRAIDIFGPDLGSLKGKTPSHKAELEEEIPVIASVQPEIQTMYVDLMYVSGLPYLLSVVNPLEYVMVHKLAKKNQNSLWSALYSHITHITKYGFKISTLRVDGESAIKSEWFDSRLSSLGINLDSTGAGEAVAVVERKIQTVKQRIRAIINTLPYKLSEKLEGWLVRYAVSRIVLQPTRNSGEYTSPREKLYGRKVNVDKELKHGFGDYVQVHTATLDNTMQPRTSGAIALMSTGNLEGSWYYMLLSNLKIVNRTKATVLPVTDNIIEYLNQTASDKKGRTVIDTYELDTSEEDLDPDTVGVQLPNMITPVDRPLDSEHVPYGLETELEDTEELYTEENSQIVAEETTTHDDVPVDSQALLDDIFGADEEEVEEEIDDGASTIAQPTAPPQLRRSPRLHEKGRWEKKVVGIATRHTYSLKMTVSEGINKLGNVAVESISKEMSQMCDMKVWEGVKLDSLTHVQKRKIITSSMFLKDKYHADGKFDKLKSRLVAGGHLQDRNIYNNGSSPTASTSSIFMIAALAAREGRAVATIDFPGAFLNSDMPSEGDHEVLMRLNRYLSGILIGIDPSYKKYLNSNNTIIVRLKKALYGCVESSKLWYDKISGDMCRLGFTINPYDICVFNRIEACGSQTTCVIHVDDMMITCKDQKHLDMLIDSIELTYPGLTKYKDKVLNYLGMTFDFTATGKVKITMEGYIGELLKGCEDLKGTAPTPAKAELFQVNPESSDPLLDDKMREKFHSITAQLLYLCKRVRPDILTAVAFLTKRVTKPQQEDYNKLTRVIQYIRATQDMGMILEVRGTPTVTAYVDASYGVHPDMKSHTGCLVTLGAGPIFAKSGTQKLNTKSSTEAELVGMSDSGNQVIWTRNFLSALSYDMPPATIYQDNMSTIQLINNGRSNSEKTRHVDIKYFFLHDRIIHGDICVKYMNTKDMIADVLTKPLQGEPFRVLRNKLLNWYV